MSYSISSDKFQHPLLKPILTELTEYFKDQNIQFFVIGATARDIILSIYDQKAIRLTKDLDIAIAISNWEDYKKVEEGLILLDNFEKDQRQRQRFTYKKDFVLDIVPYGEIKNKDDKIFWPSDETIAMNVLGYNEVKNHTINVQIDNNLKIEVAGLDSIFILKIFAWDDRKYEHNRDAEDIGFIINNYLSIYEERAATE
ncbi:MAG: nucleotidyl transferase AbiEii/AbiGii toxin family protein [Bacteroidales bacterium]